MVPCLRLDTPKTPCELLALTGMTCNTYMCLSMQAMLSLPKDFCLADAAETAIGRDPVDTQIRSAFSPIVNPVLSSTARRPSTATATAAAAGPATPLVSCGAQGVFSKSAACGIRAA